MQQKNTAIDCEYSEFENIKNWEVPEEMKKSAPLSLPVYLPKSDEIIIDESLPTVLYHLWNLDADFEKNIQANRVLIIEPKQMKKSPMSQKKIEWLLEYAKENIEGIQVFVGNIDEFYNEYKPLKTVSQDYVMVRHWTECISEMKERPKIFPEITGFYSSFFGYWKKVTKKSDHIKAWHV